MKVFFVFILTLISFISNSQLGSWSIINAKLNLNEKWALFGEAQLRSLHFYDDFHYYELKGGASVSINKNFSVAIGMGNFDTYSPGGNFKKPMSNDEFRTWLQLSMNQYLERIKFEHRYRAEQRFTLTGYKNRFRYRINIVIPITNSKVIAKTLYLNASNEIFFTGREPYFERNRLFFGCGYELSDQFAIQGGYIRQFDYKLTDETGKGFLQIAFLFDLEWKNKSVEKVPGSMN